MKRETYQAMLDKIRRTVLYGYVIWSDRILTRISLYHLPVVSAVFNGN